MLTDYITNYYSNLENQERCIKIIDTLYQIEVEKSIINVTLHDGRIYTFQRSHFPEPFLRWQSEARLQMIETLQTQGADGVRSQPAHLPVLATIGNGLFAVNLSTKGMGLVPKQDCLRQFITRFEQTRIQSEGEPWSTTLPLRVAAIREFYLRFEHFDPWM